MENSAERREARRFTMTLPLTVRCSGPSGIEERQGRTRDVSFRGLYFWTDADFPAGSEIEFTLILPKEVTRATDVNIHCKGRILRVEPRDGDRGVAARIEHYEFLHSRA
jgi:hypothetical protein